MAISPILFGRMAINMPLTTKGRTILTALGKEYGPKKGTSVFYAMINAGKIKGAEKMKGKRVLK